MVARRLLLALVLGCLGLGACHSLSFPNGSIECSDDANRRCPTGYSCIQNHCWIGAGSDGGASDLGTD